MINFILQFSNNRAIVCLKCPSRFWLLWKTVQNKSQVLVCNRGLIFHSQGFSLLDWQLTSTLKVRRPLLAQRTTWVPYADLLRRVWCREAACFPQARLSSSKHCVPEAGWYNGNLTFLLLGQIFGPNNSSKLSLLHMKKILHTTNMMYVNRPLHQLHKTANFNLPPIKSCWNASQYVTTRHLMWRRQPPIWS